MSMRKTYLLYTLFVALLYLAIFVNVAQASDKPWKCTTWYTSTYDTTCEGFTSSAADCYAQNSAQSCQCDGQNCYDVTCVQDTNCGHTTTTTTTTCEAKRICDTASNDVYQQYADCTRSNTPVQYCNEDSGEKCVDGQCVTTTSPPPSQTSSCPSLACQGNNRLYNPAPDNSANYYSTDAPYSCRYYSYQGCPGGCSGGSCITASCPASACYTYQGNQFKLSGLACSDGSCYGWTATDGTSSLCRYSDPTNNYCPYGCSERSCNAPPPCSGTAFLTLSPNPVDPGASFTATVSGFDCAGGTARFYRYDSGSWESKGSCPVSGSGCSVTITAPSTAGSYRYFGGVDKDGDGFIRSTGGEGDWESLTVGLTDSAKPSISAFSVSPAAPSWVNSQNPNIDVFWTVSDAGGSHLKQVEVWRENENQGNWAQIPGSPFVAPSGTDGPWSSSARGFAADGVYRYGIIVVDNAGNDKHEREAGFSVVNVQVDTVLPVSKITTPLSGTFDKDFSVFTSDSDSGGSGLSKCHYKVYDTGLGTYTRSKTERPCNEQFSNVPFTVTVGPNGDCKTLGTNTCQVHVFSTDNAGNTESTDIKTYSIASACSGSISISLDKSSVGTGEDVTASVSVPSCSKDKTINYRTELSGVIQDTFSCVSAGSTGCNWNLNAPTFPASYVIRAWVDLDNDGSSFTFTDANENTFTTLEVVPCTTTKPSQTFELDNKCSVKIEATGLDISDGTDGRYLNTVNVDGSNKITTEFDDATSGGCGKDLKFSNAWNTGGTTDKSWLSITSNKLEKKGCGFLGLFCPHDTAYGFTLSTSGTCNILERITSCVPTGDQHTCPAAGFGTKSSLALMKDTGSFQTHTFRIGECSTNSDCNTLKGPGFVCNADKMCEATGCGSCSSARALGNLNNFGDTLTEKTCTISSEIQDDIFKFTVNKKGNVIVSLTSTAQIGIDGVVKKGTDYCSPPILCSTGPTSVTNPTVSCSFYASETGEYGLVTTWWGGTGKADVSVKLETDCGACAFPKSVGTLANYGNELKTTTCLISQQLQDDFYTFATSKEGYIIGTITNEVGVDLTFEAIVSGSNYCTGSTAYLTPDLTKTLVTDKKLAAGTYSAIATWDGGKGTADVKLRLGQCVVDKDCPVQSGTNFVGRCDSPSGSASPKTNSYICRYPRAEDGCSFNVDCNEDLCCTREGQPTTGNPGPAKPKPGSCKTLEQPYICTK